MKERWVHNREGIIESFKQYHLNITKEEKEAITKSKKKINQQKLIKETSRRSIVEVVEWCRGNVEPSTKTYMFANLLSPEGILYKHVCNLREFCKENNLGLSAIQGLVCSKRLHYKSWIRLNIEGEVLNIQKTQTKVYGDLRDPNGIIHQNVTSLYRFCKQHNLAKSAIQALFKGVGHTYKGWTVVPSGQGKV